MDTPAVSLYLDVKVADLGGVTEVSGALVPCRVSR